MNARPVRVITASAGTGKTTRLSHEVLAAIRRGIPPEAILATTFTNKAAEELEERIRVGLLREGAWEAADAVRGGRLGTMNSVFGGLLATYAFDLGLSPTQRVMPEDEASVLFQTAATQAIDAEREALEPAAARMGFADWHEIVEAIANRARQNAIPPSRLGDWAERSWTSLAAWLPPSLSSEEGERLDRELQAAIRDALAALPFPAPTKTMETARQLLQRCVQAAGRGPLPWADWAAAAKLNAGVAGREAVRATVAAASHHPKHPRLRSDLETIIRGVFRAGANALEAYAAAKRERGLVDFTDQEALALRLLDVPAAVDRLRDEVRLVLVDEVQDSSPLELSLIVRLHAVVDESIWVGDPKQAIYGFRDTDHGLTAAVLAAMDPTPDILDQSHRSRPDLVEWVNATFVPAFSGEGIPPDRIALTPSRRESDQPPALEVWRLEAGTNAETMGAVAEGIRRLLQRPELHPVVDRITGMSRPLKGSDIAVLARTNAQLTTIAGALGALRLRTSVGEPGLLSTPEAVAGLAALRWLMDPTDTLALVELLHHGESQWRDGGWFRPWIEGGGDPPPAMVEALEERFRPARARLPDLTPAEALDLALALSGVQETAARWGNARERLGNLERLRGLAAEYEDICGMRRVAATVPGLLLFFAEEVAGSTDRNMLAESSDPDAVQLMTFHKGKGLEWPMVILPTLDSGGDRALAAFNSVRAYTAVPIDPARLLEGRGLHFWPWPYGKHKKDVHLDAAEGAPESERARVEQQAEDVRLLYVAMTRARDYLVLAHRSGKPAAFLDRLENGTGNGSVVELPARDGEALRAGGVVHRAAILDLRPPDDAGMGRPEREPLYGPLPASGPAAHRPAHIQPSHAGEPSGSVPPWTLHRAGERLPMAGSPDMATVGSMVHAFLAADRVEWPWDRRRQLADAVLTRWQIAALQPEGLVTASDRLAAFIRERYVVEEAHREWPVFLTRDGQSMRGWLDLVLRTERGWVIVDHKTFPGAEKDWVSHAARYVPQLQLYAEAVTRATHEPVVEAVMHMPVVGTFLVLQEPAADRVAAEDA
jgi:ATP-dependent exoDNAse (exonuclease V) beta subunit